MMKRRATLTFLFKFVFICRGNFGTVRRATHKETGIKYAAKFLRRRRRAACWAKQIQHEIAVLMLSADSKQIVKLHAVYETRSEFVLILEM
jgi:serine/threonine kinase 17